MVSGLAGRGRLARCCCQSRKSWDVGCWLALQTSRRSSWLIVSCASTVLADSKSCLTRPTSSTCPTVASRPQAGIVLELRNLVKHYKVGDGPAIRAVDGLSLTAADGEFVALYGPSGSGKTTLLELVAGAQRPDGGTVVLDGREICELSERELDEYRLTQLGIVGQPQEL